MERIENFKSFSTLKNQIREETKNKEIETKRNESATSFASLLSKYGVSNVSEISEDQLPEFMNELMGEGVKAAADKDKYDRIQKQLAYTKELKARKEKEAKEEALRKAAKRYGAKESVEVSESVESIDEAMGRNLSPEVAAATVKKYGNEKWGERAGYGNEEGYYILRSLGIQMAKAAGIDKAPGDFDYPYSIYFDGGDLVLGDKTVGKTRGKSLAQVAQMYTALVGKALAALAKKNKSNESVEVIEEDTKRREAVASAWKELGIKDLNGIAKLYADAMEDANFHEEMGTSRAIGSASRGKVSGASGSDISSAASWDGYAIANGTVDYLKEIGEESAANKLYKAISKYDLNESIAFATNDLVTAIMEGTRGQFGKIYKSGEIASVYTHYDSYPEHMLPTIKKGYKKGTDVDAVLGKGDNSGLEVSPDKMKFYGDPNSLKPMMGTVKNLKKYVNDADAQGAEYIYLFDERDQKWYMVDVYGDRDLVPAFEAVEIDEETIYTGQTEVDIIPEVEGEFMQLYSKLNDLAEETTDTKWRKAIESIIKGLEGVENKIGQTANKLGVVPTHESEEVEEGNAFGAARAEAIAKGEKTFKVGDEEYDVESVDKEDKENAEEFANEAEGAAIPAETMTADTTKGEEKKVINGEEVDEEPKEVTLEPLVEGAKEEQEAMELYVKLVDPKTGKYTEKEMQAMSEKDIVEVVDAEGYKGSEAKKLSSELVKIAKG